jgi:phage terminase small subunit
VSLSKKRRVFVEEYLQCWNATEAARRAKYKHPNKQGPYLVKLGIIAEEITRRLKEKTMSADEVLSRLAEQARSEQTKYLVSNGNIDLERLIADGKAHLVKGTRWDGKGNLTIEFHDAQAALVHLGRHYKLFTDQMEHTGSVIVKVVRGISTDDL